jgi:Zn ribbon nucleic-acid-binding protein
MPALTKASRMIAGAKGPMRKSCKTINVWSHGNSPAVGAAKQGLADSKRAVVAPGVTSLIAVRRNDRFIAVSLAANFCVGTRR